MHEISCQQARSMVSEYMNGELDQENVQHLEHHLQYCTSCPSLYASLVKVQRRLHQLQQTPLPKETLESITYSVNEALRAIQ